MVSEKKLSDAEAESNSAKGRMCPLSYRYDPEHLARDPELEAQTLYVIGGLYGNDLALAELNRLAAAETAPVRFVFNGDFNCFNAESEWFEKLNREVLAHTAISGNVEREIAEPGDQAGLLGCGPTRSGLTMIPSCAQTASWSDCRWSPGPIPTCVKRCALCR